MHTLAYVATCKLVSVSSLKQDVINTDKIVLKLVFRRIFIYVP